MKKQVSVGQDTVQRALDYFTKINDYLAKNKSHLNAKDNDNIAKLCGTSSYLIYKARENGLYDKDGRGMFVPKKNINEKDVKELIAKINEDRTKNKKTLKSNKNEKDYKPKTFEPKNIISERFFVVSEKGQIICRPTGKRKARLIADKQAKESNGSKFYICEIRTLIGVEYVSTVRNF